MSSSPFTGSLGAKRKAELVEIAQALGIEEADVKVADLVKSIQSYLDSNETSLKDSPRFKGLYHRRRTHLDSDSDSAAIDLKNGVEETVKKGRKSFNKAVDRIANAIDPANVALPDSPIVTRISDAADSVRGAVVSANDSLSVALAPSNDLQRGLVTRFNHASTALVKFSKNNQSRVDDGVKVLREHFSRPEHLVSSAIGIELLFLLAHVVQFYDHTLFFPPPGGDKGTIASLLHSLFFWAPSFSLTFRLPEIAALKPGHDVWSAVAWWVSTTVLPPLALSTVISSAPFKKQATHNTRHTTTNTKSTTSPDPLSFAIFRLATLLYPLTSAAPSSIVDALEISGNLQGRALGAGLLAVLVLAYRVAA